MIEPIYMKQCCGAAFWRVHTDYAPLFVFTAYSDDVRSRDLGFRSLV